MPNSCFKSILLSDNGVPLNWQCVFCDFSGLFLIEEVCVAMNTEADNGQYNVWEASGSEEEVDQFKLLEEKVDSLIEKTIALKSEKEAIEEKLRIAEEKVAELNGKIEKLRSGKNDAKQKILSLLEKMEQVAG